MNGKKYSSTALKSEPEKNKAISAKKCRDLWSIIYRYDEKCEMYHTHCGMLKQSIQVATANIEENPLEQQKNKTRLNTTEMEKLVVQ